MWRFLTIGDSFIDFIMSRVTNSYIYRHEVESVNVRLQSDKLFHIMRDHPRHNFPILAGMWGFKIRENRSLAQKIFNLSIDCSIILDIDPKNREPKGTFLIFYVFDWFYRKLILERLQKIPPFFEAILYRRQKILNERN